MLCVFGAGGDRDREKRPLMGRVASELADVAIVTSDNPRSRGSGRDHPRDRRRCRQATFASSRTAAPRSSAPSARPAPGDVVVIAGKGHEQGQELADRKLPFDDRDVARQALRRLAGGSVIALRLDELEALLAPTGGTLER